MAVGRKRHERRRNQGHISGLIARAQPQTLHVREQCSEPIGQRPVLDVEDQSDRAGFGTLAQAVGLSAIVSGTSFASPPRRSPSVTVWPTLSGPSARKSERT